MADKEPARRAAIRQEHASSQKRFTPLTSLQRRRKGLLQGVARGKVRLKEEAERSVFIYLFPRQLFPFGMWDVFEKCLLVSLSYTWEWFFSAFIRLILCSVSFSLGDSMK